jgi:hypothetical protein
MIGSPARSSGLIREWCLTTNLEAEVPQPRSAEEKLDMCIVNSTKVRDGNEGVLIGLL